MRAQARTPLTAMILVLIMLASTQLVLLSAREYYPEELPENNERFVLDNSEVIKIDLGVDHACAIGSLNQMKCWGSGDDGKTGHENSEHYGDDELEMGQYLMFADVGTGLTFTEVSAGGAFTCALLSDSSVKCWGANQFLGSSAGENGSGAKGDGYLEMGSGVATVDLGSWSATSISSGNSHACAIVNDGVSDALVCWGENSDGQLGLEHTNTIGDESSDLSGGELPHVDLPSRGSDLAQVSSGKRHTCVLWEDGEMACWGKNGHGQLGIGNTDTIGDQAGEMGDSLTLVDLPSGRVATYIAAGDDMTCAILDNGDLACWGRGASGRLGTEDESNRGDSADELGDGLNIVDMGSGLTVQSMGIGQGSSCAILDDGVDTDDNGDGVDDTPDVLKCWGEGYGGVLGQGDADNIGDDVNEMGNYLLAVDLGSDVHPISVDVGDAYTCALMNTSMVKCWGLGLDGRHGLGFNGNYGDQSSEMGDSLPYVELYLPEETFDRPCDLPAEGAPLSQETLENANSYIGNKTSTALTPESCGSVAYTDEVNKAVRFALFQKGKWATETVVEYEDEVTIRDVSLAIDSNGMPHIAVVTNTTSGADDLAKWEYYTKKDGDWVGSSNSMGNEKKTRAVSIDLDSNGDIFLLVQWFQDLSPSPDEKKIDVHMCTSAVYSADSCIGASGFGTHSPNWTIDAASSPMDTDVSPQGMLHLAFLDGDAASRFVSIVEIDSTGVSSAVRSGGVGHEANDNASLAIDLGLDGSIHLAYLGGSGGLHYSSCPSSCGDSESWSSEELPAIYESGVIDLSIGPDLSAVIISGTEAGTHALHKTDGGWEIAQLGSIGGSDWVGLEISEQGKMWAYSYYPGTSSSLTLFLQEGMTTSGLLSDIDGDGWTRLEEIRCGTDYIDSSSSPSDSDGDGTCDEFDDWVDSSLSAESDVISVGERFGCAVMSNGSVACWGDNSEGQLGNPSAGSSSDYATLVQLPVGFQARSVDSGSAHACSTGLDGTLVCWGRNTEGQLGRGTVSPQELPGLVTMPPGVSVSKFSTGTDHSCLIGTDSKLYCWGNASMERTGKVVNEGNTTYVYENFTDNSRSWSSGSSSYLQGPTEGIEYIDKLYYSSWFQNSISSDSSFTVSIGDIISFRMRGWYHGDQGASSEWIKFYANDQLIHTKESNSTSASTPWSDWQDVHFTVPESYSGSGLVSIKIEIRGYRNYVQIDNLKIKNFAYGGHSSLNSPQEVKWTGAGSVRQLSLGSSHSCALNSSGGIHCWGNNGGQYGHTLGSPTFRGTNSVEPIEVNLSGPDSLASSPWSGSTVEGITAGDGVTCALMRSGESVCWGESRQQYDTTPEPAVIDTPESGGEVGSHPALSKDSSGNWVIAYQSEGSISLARHDGSSWVIEDVCSSEECDGIGNSIIVEKERLHISSFDHESDSLVYSRLLENHTSTLAYANDNPYYTAIDVGPSGERHVVYYDSGQRDMMYTSHNGTGWSEPEQIEAYSDGNKRPGRSYNDVSVDSSGVPHVSYVYYDRAANPDVSYLKYAWKNDSSWNVTTLQSIVTSSVIFTSIDLDSSGNPHISYWDPVNTSLRYTYFDGTSWSDSTLQSTSSVGQYNSIALDSNDYPRISHYNSSHADLEIAVWDGSAWGFTKVDSTSSTGTWTSIAVDDSDNTLISYCYGSGADVRLARHDGAAWRVIDVDTVRGCQFTSLGLSPEGYPRLAYYDYSADDAWISYSNDEDLNGWTSVQVETAGNIGSYVSMAVDSQGTAHMSYRDQDNADLRHSTVYTRTLWSSESAAPTGDLSGSHPGSFVGVSGGVASFVYPNASSGMLEHLEYYENATYSYIVEGESSTTGLWSAFSLDGNGDKHIAYYNSSSYSMDYAKSIGNLWQTQSVDSGTGSSSGMRHMSIAMGPDNLPHISYVEEALDLVKYAHFDGSSWNVTQIDDLNYDVFDTSIVLNSSGLPEIAYMVRNYSGSTWDYGLRYATFNGTSWSIDSVMSRASGYSWGSLDHALNSSDSPHIVYFDDYDDSLYHAAGSNGSWVTTKIKSNAGYYSAGYSSSSIAIDSDGGLHVSYYERSGRDLEYAYLGFGETSWAITADVAGGSTSYYFGVDNSIGLDSNGKPRIAYFEPSFSDLEFASCDSSCDSASSWEIRTLAEDGTTGQYVEMSIDHNDIVHMGYYNSSSSTVNYLTIRDGPILTQIGEVGSHHYQLGGWVDQAGSIHISFFNGTDTSGTLQHAEWDGYSWTLSTVDSIATMTGAYSDIALDSDGKPHISYIDTTDPSEGVGNLRYAQHDGSAWVTSTIDAGGTIGGFTSIALDYNDVPWISYFDTDDTAWSASGQLRLATKEDGVWTHSYQDNGAGKGSEVGIDSGGVAHVAYFDEDGSSLNFSRAGQKSPAVMGDSDFHATGTPVDSGSTEVSSIDVGETHGCAVISGEVKCWGVSTNGQLGNGIGSMTSAEPVSSTPVTGWTPLEVSVSASSGSDGGTSCALFSNDATDERRIICWGEGSHGQIGDGVGSDANIPDSTNIVMFDASNQMGAAESSGSLSSSPYDVAEISLDPGGSFGCARSNQGHIKCWGQNANGQLGHGNTSTASDGPNEMGENLAFTPIGSNSTAIEISVGTYHACALLDDGSVKCWGRNAEGAIGTGSSGSIGDQASEMGDNLATIDLGTGATATSITTGSYHSCAILDNGSVKCWGDNGYGQLGIGSTYDMGDGADEMGDNLATVDLGTGRTAIQIEAGSYHTCAILDSGVMKCWGMNSYGQLGLGHTENVGRGVDLDGNSVVCIPGLETATNLRECDSVMGDGLSAVDLGEGRTAAAMALGHYHTCAILDNGSVRCWGLNTNGRTGLGTSTGSQGDSAGEMGDELPTVDLGSGRTAASISAGYSHTCVLLDNLSVACWGDNSRGQLGIGSTDAVDTAEEMGSGLMTAILPTTRSISIESGNYHSCAVIDDGTVRCWGEEATGRLGVYRELVGDIGGSESDLGGNLPMTNLHMVPDDFDGDGWIDIWDTDDDDDGYADSNDDLPFDERDWFDHDSDGLGVNVDTDDDDASVRTADQDTALKWSDTEEMACGTLWWSSLSEPTDYDGDGICDALDDDVDGNGWNDSYQCECSGLEDSTEWNSEPVFSSSGNAAFNYDSNTYGYDFFLSDHGLRLMSTNYDDAVYQWLLRHDSTTTGAATTFSNNNQFNYWDVASQNGLAYISYKTGVGRMSDVNASMSGGITVMSHDATTSTDLAVSHEGDMVVRWHESSNDGTIRGYYLNGSTFYASAPGGLSAPDTGGGNQHGQIAFSPGGRLHALIVNNSSGVIGFYHTYADLGGDLSGSVDLTWSTPNLVLERQQSTGWSSGASHSATEDHTAELHYSSDGTLYAAMYNGTNLWLSTLELDDDPSDDTWVSEIIAESTGKNEGVDIATNSTGTAYIAWINHTSDLLMLSNKSSGSWSHEEVWQSDGWQESTSTQTLNYARLTLEFDRLDDPFIMSIDANLSDGSALIHYKGSLLDPSYTFSPIDSNGDGICDTLQYAVMDFGASSFIYTMGDSVEITPTFSGKELVEVWAPSLPAGLSLNSSTGVISGTPEEIDTSGTEYTVYSNSTTASYPVPLEFIIRSPAPIQAGFGRLDQHQYLSIRNGPGYTLHEFDPAGNLIYYGLYYSNSEWSADGISVSIGSGDLYVAKRWANGTWAWVVPLDLNGASGGAAALAVDDSGNSYIVGHRTSGALDLPGNDHDLPNREAAFFVSLDGDGGTRWAQDAYMTSGSSNANWHVSTDTIVNTYGFSRIHVDGATGELTIAGQVSTSSSSDRSLAFGNLTLEIPLDHYNFQRPFVTRIDPSGDFSWATTVTPSSNYHRTLQGMGVHEDGGVDVLIRGYGSTTLGEISTGPDSVHYVIGRLNLSGNWTDSSTIVSEDPAGFDETYDSAMMEAESDGDLAMAIWTIGDTNSLNISGNVHWFNDTCADSMVVLRMDGLSLAASSSREFCLSAGASNTAEYYSIMKVDPQDRIVLLLGSRVALLGDHHRIMRLDSSLNPDFEEKLLKYNNPSYTYYLDWEYVSFDPLGNMMVDLYTSDCNLYWDGSLMGRTAGSCNYQTHFLMEAVGHTISGESLTAGEIGTLFGVMGLSAMGATCDQGANYCNEYLDGWEASGLPSGLSIDPDTGVISGSADSNASLETYTLWMNDTALGNNRINVSFLILNGKPTVTYSETDFIFERGAEITPISPTEIEGAIINWTFVPDLPAGLSLGESNGTIFGTPVTNLTQQAFQLRVSSDGGTTKVDFQLTINEPIATISYGNGTYVIPRDSVVSIAPTIVGGFVETFAINSTDFPLGLSFNTSNGKFEGIPLLVTNNTTYTVWANNSGGSTSTEISIWIVGNGLTLAFPTSDLTLTEGVAMQPIAGQTSGSTPESWEVYPDLPNGLFFGETNGTLWGVPTDVQNQTNYTIWANASGDQTSSVTISITVLIDTDGDEIADIFDPDDDGDGWNDTAESECGTDPLESSSTPSDGDGDGLCDSLDSSNDAEVVMIYPESELDLIVNITMVNMSPITSGGGITSWENSPELPSGLLMNNTTGTIVGTANETFAPMIINIWANNSVYSASFNITVSSSLLDTDSDGIPDETDDDDDGDGWSDSDEVACATDPLGVLDYPEDGDGDGLCDPLDSVDDSPLALAYSESELNLTTNVSILDMQPIVFGGDVRTWELSPEMPSGLLMNNTTGYLSGTPSISFELTNYTIWANNSQHGASFTLAISSWLTDTDGDGIPDETDDDDDGDGWSDSDEVACATDPLGVLDYPEDGDGDGLCDPLDSVDDTDLSLAYPASVVNLTTNVSVLEMHPIVFGGEVLTWEVSSEMPEGIFFSQTSGVISGVSESSFEITNYTIWANNSQFSDSFVIGISSSLLDTDGDGIPDETDDDDDGDGWSDSDEEDCLTGSLDPNSFPSDEDEDELCDGLDPINDSPIYLVFSRTTQLMFVSEPIEQMIGTTYGGDVRTWEISPLLPAGITLNGAMTRSTPANGTLSGAPMFEFPLGVWTIWANNSQYSSSVEITMQSVTPDEDDSSFDLIYLEDTMNLTTNVDLVYLEPGIFGGNISQWSISPELPDGLFFNITNGVITGIPNVEINSTTYTITGTNSMHISSYNLTISSKLLDTDGDGDPDITDPDDDADGWGDILEVGCGTDPLDIFVSPDDYDGDYLCDSNDDFDDSPIVFFYPNDKLVLVVGEEMELLAPIIAPTSGDIFNFTVIPELPKGLVMDNSTGVISGIPEEPYNHLILEYSHRFSAGNSQWNFSYRVDFDVLPPIDNNTDEDGDGWTDAVEMECNTDPTDAESIPEDIDLDSVCSYIDEDDDGDNIGDVIDKFPSNPTAWDDTDNDSMPDELTCKYLTDSANCIFELEEDLDDDNDGWPDLNETSCGTNPKDNLSIPEDDDGDGICNLLEDYVPNAVKILWICCFPLLLLLLLLLWVINPFVIDEEEIMGPEPEFTYTEGDWIGGTGEYDDPYILKSVMGVKKGSFAQSHELIKVSNITPRLKCEFTDMAAEENGTRFKKRAIKSNSRGEIEFNLEFRDDGNTQVTTEYTSLIRLGKATVYFQWTVEVEVIIDTPEEERAKRRAAKIKREAKKEAERIEKESAGKAAEAEIEAKRKATAMEMELKTKIEKIEKEAEERAASAELKALEAEKRVAEIEKEAAKRAEELERKSREEESRILEEQEAEARLAAEEKAKKDAEEAAEREKKAEEEAAELRALLRKKAEERKEEEAARLAAEEAAKLESAEEAERIEREAEERAARLEQEALEKASRIEREAARKAEEREREMQMKAMEAKEKLRKRAVERKKLIEQEEKENQEAREMAEERFAEMEKEIEERKQKLDKLDKEAKKKERALLRVAEKSKEIDFGILGFATSKDRQDLQKISGIGPFIEEKLNALGIFTFNQISKMNSELEEKVNDAIEFFPGRIKRDEWSKQARKIIDEGVEGIENGGRTPMGGKTTEPSASEIIETAEEQVSKQEGDREVARRMEMAEELLKKKTFVERESMNDSDEIEIDYGIIGFVSPDEEKDDLQAIDGIGRFVEEKLNKIGIYKISQISKMTPDISDQVNDSIGLSPGRIERDEWVLQAKRMMR